MSFLFSSSYVRTGGAAHVNCTCEATADHGDGFARESPFAIRHFD